MTELQKDRQDKNNMPPDLRSRGHKKQVRRDLQGMIFLETPVLKNGLENQMFLYIYTLNTLIKDFFSR